MYRFTLAHRNPFVNGCSGSPATFTALPSSTVTSMAHVSGQSCGQAAFTTLRAMRSTYYGKRNRRFAERQMTFCGKCALLTLIPGNLCYTPQIGFEDRTPERVQRRATFVTAPNFLKEICMTRFALVAAVVVVAACSKADNTPADTTTPAMAPAPAPSAMDTGMKMDTSHKMDTTKKT